MGMKKKILALAVASCFAVTAAFGAADKADEQPQPKIAPFVWTVLSAVGQAVLPSFISWLTGRAETPAQEGNAGRGPGLNTSPYQPFDLLAASTSANSAFVTSLTSVLGQIVGNLLSAKSLPAMTPVDNPVIMGDPDIPLQAKGGQPNYQGLHLAVVSVDPTGKTAQISPLSKGFSTGQRIKLRAVSTFDAIVVIDNVNPSGVRSRIYPPQGNSENVVFLKAGQPVLLPLAADQFFEFANQKGQEQLQVTIRDPRGANQPSNQPIYRKDEEWGSNMMQLTPEGTYPGFTQTISLRHN